MKPNRVQRKRTKGYKSPPNTKYVGRPSKYGNPFKLDGEGRIMYYSIASNAKGWKYWSVSNGFEIKDVVELYELWLKGEFDSRPLPNPPNNKDIQELAKYENLSCFCNKKNPCHIDILLTYIT